MRRRTSISEMFSTFLDAKNERLTWITDYKLKSNINLMMEQNPENDEKYWSKYWLKKAISDQDIVAKQHLTSYLEESCYWAAMTVKEKFDFNNLSFLMIDLIQIARELTCSPEKLFKTYTYNQSTVKTYALFALKNHLLAEVYKKNNLNRYSDWGLLRITSKKNVINALQEIGFNELQLCSLVLAWKVFNEIYTSPKIRYASSKLKIPTLEEFSTMANYYNHYIKQLSLNYSPKSVSISEIESLLETCIQAVRQSNRIEFVSISELYQLEDIKSLPDQSFNLNDSEEYLEPITVLQEALETLPEKAKQMFVLFYGLKMSQAEISKVFSLKAYQISRNLKRSKETLLQKVLVNFSQTNQLVELEKLRESLRVLNKLLSYYYKNNFDELLNTTVIEELNNEIPILLYYYGASNSVKSVANYFNISEFEIQKRVTKVKEILQEKLHIWIQTRLKIDSDSFDSINTSIAALVEEWLTIAPYAAFQVEQRNQ